MDSNTGVKRSQLIEQVKQSLCTISSSVSSFLQKPFDSCYHWGTFGFIRPPLLRLAVCLVVYQTLFSTLFLSYMANDAIWADFSSWIGSVFDGKASFNPMYYKSILLESPYLKDDITSFSFKNWKFGHVLLSNISMLAVFHLILKKNKGIEVAIVHKDEYDNLQGLTDILKLSGIRYIWECPVDESGNYTKDVEKTLLDELAKSSQVGLVSISGYHFIGKGETAFFFDYLKNKNHTIQCKVVHLGPKGLEDKAISVRAKQRNMVLSS